MPRPGFDFPSMLTAFRNGHPNMDSSASGFYWRYRLFTQYHLRIREIGLDGFFLESFPMPASESELDALPSG